jgi:glycosyltransferase involved in cell wall biosynthesis
MQHQNRKGRILFVVPYPYDTAPGQRFRFEQYLDLLVCNGFEYKLKPFLNANTQKILYRKGFYFRKFIGVIHGYLGRLLLIPQIIHYDFIFIYREATPLGPPLFEWVVVKIFKKKIIYDFDDAIWLPTTSTANKLITQLKNPDKVRFICKWAYKVSCGNDYLLSYALHYNSNSILNPTTVDTERLHIIQPDDKGLIPIIEKKQKLVVGWTGTHSTLHYLQYLLPVLQKVEQVYNFEFCVISDQAPDFKLGSLRYIRWKKSSEISDLQRFDIGVMPLTDDQWSQGKCGFKVVQYMALGIPALASPVGVNKKIIKDKINGFLCESETDWEIRLIKLLQSAQLRKFIGINARQTVEDFYSVKSNTKNFLGLFV